MANNKPFIVKSGLIPQTDNDQDLGGANNKFANAHISNLSGAVSINSAFTLPTTDGSTGNVLQTDGAGNITWADLAAVTFSDTAPASPQTGDLWFDSGTTAELFIWTGTEWISATGGDQAAFTMREFTGDGSTTAFDTNNPNNVSFFVYLNGILLKETNDYSVASGVVTFVTAPALNDTIQVVIHGNAEFIDLSSYATISYVDSQIQSQDNTDEITEGTTNLYYTDARVQTKLGSVSGDIIPDTNIAYDLGSATNRFRDLYLSGNSITLGTKQITQDNIPEVDLSIAPEILEIQVDAPAAGQDTAWLWTWLTSSLPYARRAITNSPEVSVPIYQQGTYTINNYAAYDLHGSMTQTHTLYFKWIDGAGTDNLVSWVTSSGPVSDSHPDINGGSATDVQRLSISVPATVTPPVLTPPNVSYTVTNNGSGAYTFSGSANGDNPNIGPLYRGGTYTFNVSASGHPFYLTTDNGTNFSAGTYFGEYTNGVTGSRNDSGTVTITVPADAPNTLYYQCGNHGPMRGAITVKDLAVETNINGNYVIYAQHTQEGHKTPVEIRPIPSLVNQMCLVYDASVNKFVPQDLATYVENTPSFENKIREVAGTAELVVEDGSTVIAKVNVYDDSTYLPLTGNNPGDQAFATDTNILYIWDGSAWQQAGASNTDDLTEGSANLFYTNERVDDRVAALVVGGNNITATYDDVAGTLTLDGLPGYTDTDVSNYLTANGYDTATNIVASITDSAPATLDTLNELAAALGDDPNFATTVTNSIATKAPINNPTFTGVISGDGSGITNLVFPATSNRYRYVATAGQTSFTATYITGFVDVYLNGAKLDSATEFTDTSGTSIVLTTGANLNDIVEIIAQNTTSVSDAVSASGGGTFNGPITAPSFTGDLIGTASDSQLLDGLDSTSFLRSDVTSDTMNGLLVFSGNSGEITLTLGSKGSGGPLFPPLASNHASVIAEYELISSQVSANLVLDTGGLGKIKLETDTTINGTLQTSTGNVYVHTGNYGSGNGIDADTVDGLHADNFFKEGAGTLSTNNTVGDASSYPNQPTSGVYQTSYPGHSGNVLMFQGAGSTGTVAIECTYYGDLRYHSNTDSTRWTSAQILTDQYGSFRKFTTPTTWSATFTGQTDVTINVASQFGVPDTAKAILVTGYYHISGYGQGAAGQGDHALSMFKENNSWSGTAPWSFNTSSDTGWGTYVLEHDGDASGSPHYYGAWGYNGIIPVNGNRNIYGRLGWGWSGGTHYNTLWCFGYWI